MTIRANKTIGILGGMGPGASCALHKLIIELFQAKYNLVQDCEYPELFILNVGLHGWSERGIENEKLVKAQLKKAVKKIEIYQPSFIIMACNTVHYYHQYLQSLTSVPILNMIDIC